MRHLRLAALLSLIAGSLALPAVAQASGEQMSIMQDDDLLVYRGDQVRDQTLARMKAIGVDAVRVTVLWSAVAEHARSTPARDRRFRKLGADDPRAYPKANWDRYDRLVRACGTLGIDCYFNVTFPGPAWGHEKPPASQRRNRVTWKPIPAEYGKFVRAVGTRFSGSYRDENEPVTIPRVDLWSLGNEPNQGGWLTPQWSGGKPASPTLYRRLYVAGYRALKATRHGGDVIYMGETAPLGSGKRTSRSPMRPKTFIRAMFKGGPRLAASGWAHHPYTKDLAPGQRDASPDSITLANFAELGTLLDQIGDGTGRIRRGLPLVSTEFGYETSPPDPYRKTTLTQQASFNQLGELLAWLNPRVVGQSQFLLRDVAPDKRYARGSKRYWFTYQSGLYNIDDTPKPALQAYVLPFLTAPAGGGMGLTNVWGQLRFRPNGLAADEVELQFNPAGGSDGYKALGDKLLVTSGKGYFTAQVRVPGRGQLRAVWTGSAFPGRVESLPSPVG
jgi:hypothetical protein